MPRRPIASLGWSPDDGAVAAYDVHPDGERFAIARRTGAGTEIVLWLDWIDEVQALLEG